MGIIEDFGYCKMNMKTPTKPKIIYIDMDDVLCDYSGAYEKSLNKCPEITYPQSQYGFYRNLEMLPNVLEVMTTLRYATSFGLFDVNILTAPSIKNPLSYTEKRVWVEEKLGVFWLDRLYIAPNKSKLIGDLLIDDKISGRGQELFTGEIMHFGSKTYPNWDTILKRTDGFMKLL